MEFYLLFINYLIALIIFIYGLFIQNISNISNRSVFYGVRIPIGYNENEKLIKLHRKYQRNLSISFAIYLMFMTMALSLVSQEISVIIILPETFLLLAVLALNFLSIHKRIKDISRKEGWVLDKNIVVIDTSFRDNSDCKEKISISSWWFLIPISILVITVIGIVIQGTSPLANNTSGQFRLVDNGLPALILVIIQALLIIIFYINHIITRKTKQSLNGGKVGEIKRKSRKIRYFLSGGYLIVTIYGNLLLMLISFSMCNIISQSFLSASVIVPVLIPVIISALMVIVIAKNTKEEDFSAKTTEDERIINRSDDQYYLFGSIYYNKNDPALFVEKRVGIGTTLNFAKPAAKIYMGVIAVIVIGVLALVAFMPGMTTERQVELKENVINVSGTWGTKIDKKEISKVELESELPAVLMKTNGADIGNKLYGHHKLQGYDDSVLFMGNKNKPFVAIYLKSGRLVLINYDDEIKTRKLYESIISSMELNRVNFK